MVNEIDIDSILKELQEDVAQALEKASKDVAKEGVKKLKDKSPKKTGAYAKGWGQSKRKDTIIIHNKKRAGLTHLLEKGHAKRGGGRVGPKKHIEPVEEFVAEELARRIEHELE